ncbi:MAG: hypothetical protein IPP87_02910 [Ideonella sp.]|nr:hypothetical protein [Ideonella sp.]
MTRLDAFLLLLLAAIGWACGFALVGLAAFRGLPDNHVAAAVFAAHGFVAGAALAGLRLAMAQGLPRLWSRSLREGPEGRRNEPAEPARASAFGT